MDVTEETDKNWRELENGAENRAKGKQVLERWGKWKASVTSLEPVTLT